MFKHIDMNRTLPLLICLGIAMHAPSTLAEESAQNPVTPKVETAELAANQVFATVNGKPITFQEFRTQLAETMRNRFYHGNAPEDQAETVRKEVGDLLIERVLLLEEASRRGIKPDLVKIEKVIADIDTQNAKSPEWQQQRAQILPSLKGQFEPQSQLEQLEALVRDVPPPTDEETLDYYKRNPALFTEPEKIRLSVILLKTDPSSPKAAWDKVLEKAKEIYTRIKNGADFSDEARKHSNDVSASNGGDLGYLHGGMLPEALHGKIESFKVGVVTEPVTMLEGFALFRLDERIAPKLHDFSEVKPRAQELLKREQQEQAWKGLASRLRKAANIQILAPVTSNDNKQP